VKKENVYHTRRLLESYWPSTSDKILLESTIGQALREAATAAPDRMALVEGIPEYAKRRRWTYAELLADAERVASALLEKYKPGDRVALWGDNIPEWVLAQQGIALAGMILVTLNPAFRLREAEYVLKQSEAIALICIKEYRGNYILATAREMSERLPSLKNVICFSDWEAFINTGSKSGTFPDVKPEDIAMIHYTSGTTGVPKGAQLYHRAIVSGASFMAERAHVDTGSVWMNAMPNFHYGGVGFGIMGNIIRQSTNVLVHTFEPLSFIEMCQSEKATFVFCVPAMLESVLSKYDPKKHCDIMVRHCLSGAAKVEEHLVRTLRKLNVTLSICFGQTETHGGISQTHVDDLPQDQTDTIGQPFPLIEIKIADPKTDNVLPLNRVGEICVRGFVNMLGFYKMPEATALTIRDGWLHTGDLGSMDERGFMKITGRLKEMINRGGEEIYPAEIEILLQEHPKVSQSAVVGVPQKTWGEEVAAVIIPKSFDDMPTPKELHDFCRTHMTHFKTPRIWGYMKEFPYTLNMKIKKFKIVEQIISGELMTTRT